MVGKSKPTSTPAQPANFIVVNGHAVQQLADGYVNATQLCRAGHKTIQAYRARSTSARFITETARRLSVARDEVIFTVVGGPASDRGTWVHPAIAVDICAWLGVEWIDAKIKPPEPSVRERRATAAQAKPVESPTALRAAAPTPVYQDMLFAIVHVPGVNIADMDAVAKIADAAFTRAIDKTISLMATAKAA